jgi:hypothetical protein
VWEALNIKPNYAPQVIAQPSKIRTKMLPFQLEGLDWLMYQVCTISQWPLHPLFHVFWRQELHGELKGGKRSERQHFAWFSYCSSSIPINASIVLTCVRLCRNSGRRDGFDMLFSLSQHSCSCAHMYLHVDRYGQDSANYCVAIFTPPSQAYPHSDTRHCVASGLLALACQFTHM